MYPLGMKSMVWKTYQIQEGGHCAQGGCRGAGRRATVDAEVTRERAGVKGIEEELEVAGIHAAVGRRPFLDNVPTTFRDQQVSNNRKFKVF
jgi:hypothetical protein